MNLYIKNLTSGNVSISGDEGQPNVSLVGANDTKAVPVNKVLGNELFCDSCATLITNGDIEVREVSMTGTVLSASDMESVKNGTLFDKDEDATPDDAEKLNLQAKTDLTDSDSPYAAADENLLQCDVSGGVLVINLAAGVDGQVIEIKDAEGSAGTNNITINPNGTETIQGAGSYVINTDWGGVKMYYDSASADWKVLTASSVSAADVALNTTHRSGDGSDHADVATNTVHSTGDGSDHANVALNDTHRTGDGSDHADVAANTARLAVIDAGSFIDSFEQAVAGNSTTRRFIATAAGEITAFYARANTGAATGEDTTCDVRINAISALSAVAVVDNAAGTTAVAGTVNTGANSFVAGDVIDVVQTYTAGGGPTPMADIMCSVMAKFD